MTGYQYDRAGNIMVVDERGACIGSVPEDDAALAAWLDAGNQIAAAAQPSVAELIARVNALREEHLAGGMTWGGHRWDTDDRSRANLTGTVAASNAGVPLPAGFTWRSADNENVPLTSEGLAGFAAAMLDFVNACYVRSWELKAGLEAAADPSTVDLESGWPPNA